MENLSMWYLKSFSLVEVWYFGEHCISQLIFVTSLWIKYCCLRFYRLGESYSNLAKVTHIGLKPTLLKLVFYHYAV